MINDKNFKQEGAESSTNLQGQIINVHQGLSYTDCKNIANDVFQANFLELSEKAAHIARTRAEELVDKFLNELQSKHPSSIQNMEDPSLQYALFSAQKEFAKSGDKELADLLVDILVERASIPEKNLKKIVLDESLNIISKLTSNQLDTLTIVFIIKHSSNNSITSLLVLNEYLNTYIKPFVNNLSKNDSLYQHLQYCGCSNISIGARHIESIFLELYKGLFSNGFTELELVNKIKSENLLPKYIIRCLHDNAKYQISFLNDIELEKLLKEENVSMNVISNFKNTFNQTTMTTEQVKEFLQTKYDFMATLLSVWNNSFMKNISLTSVGIAIAQANFKRKTGIEMDLGIWIKD